MKSTSWAQIQERQFRFERVSEQPTLSFEEAKEQILQRMGIKPAVEEPSVAFSYHKDCIGKPVRRSDGTLWVGDTKINLGYGWITAELPFDEAFTLITEGGHALGPALKTDHRDAANFASHGLALVDIDKGMRLDELQEHSFYKRYGSGFYTSPSHTEADHRFRIIYRLEQPITDAERMRQLYEGLLAVHGAADISCKDPARLFYGTTGALKSERTSRTLSAEGVAAALAKRELVLASKQSKTLASSDLATYAPPDLADVQKVLDDLRKHYSNFEYKTRFGVTRAVAAHIGAPQACMEMRSRWPDQDKTAKYEDLLLEPLVDTGPKLGSLIHMIRDKDPGYRKALPVPPQPTTKKFIKVQAERAPETTTKEILIEERKRKYEQRTTTDN